MFIELNKLLRDPPPSPPTPAPQNTVGLGDFGITLLHPLQLSGWIDATWETWRKANEYWRTLDINKRPLTSTTPQVVVPALGSTLRFGGEPPTLRVNIVNAAKAALDSRDTVYIHPGPPKGVAFNLSDVAAEYLQKAITPKSSTVSPPWKHLLYAYLIENTRIIEIFQRVIQEALHDETFGTLGDTTHRWLRLTEDLFFREGTASLISSITSYVRPDVCATRRNAYYRMFGLDLNHGGPEGGPYKYAKSTTANLDFVKTLQELLREVWRGYVNAKNQYGPNTTDLATIDELIDRLKNMLNARRNSADGTFTNLSREEISAVSTASWFHLAVRGASDSPIVSDLKATGTTAEERLRKLGERVKLPAHSKSRSFFFLAEDLPPLLRSIELGDFDERPAQESLYLDPDIQEITLRIINHWSVATGVDLKSLPVSASPR